MKAIEKELKAEKQKNVTIVTVNKKNVTAKTLIDKGLKAHSNESNESNAIKTQNRFLNFEASVKRLEEEQSQGVLF